MGRDHRETRHYFKERNTCQEHKHTELFWRTVLSDNHVANITIDNSTIFNCNRCLHSSFENACSMWPTDQKALRHFLFRLTFPFNNQEKKNSNNKTQSTSFGATYFQGYDRTCTRLRQAAKSFKPLSPSALRIHLLVSKEISSVLENQNELTFFISFCEFVHIHQMGKSCHSTENTLLQKLRRKKNLIHR